MTYLELRKIYLDLRDSEDYITALYRAKDLYWNVLELIQDREELDKVLGSCKDCNRYTPYINLLRYLHISLGLCYLFSYIPNIEVMRIFHFFIRRYPISLNSDSYYEGNRGVDIYDNKPIEELIDESIKSFKLRIELIDKLIIQYNTWKEKDKIH